MEIRREITLEHIIIRAVLMPSLGLHFPRHMQAILTWTLHFSALTLHEILFFSVLSRFPTEEVVSLPYDAGCDADRRHAFVFLELLFLEIFDYLGCV